MFSEKRKAGVTNLSTPIVYGKSNCFNDTDILSETLLSQSTEAYLGPVKTSMLRIFRENS